MATTRAATCEYLGSGNQEMDGLGDMKNQNRYEGKQPGETLMNWVKLQ